MREQACQSIPRNDSPMGTEGPLARVGLLSRGDRRPIAASERTDARLGPLFAAFDELNVATRRVVYAGASQSPSSSSSRCVATRRV
jgi:hypothetical protein